MKRSLWSFLLIFLSFFSHELGDEHWAFSHSFSQILLTYFLSIYLFLSYFLVRPQPWQICIRAQVQSLNHLLPPTILSHLNLSCNLFFHLNLILILLCNFCSYSSLFKLKFSLFCPKIHTCTSGVFWFVPVTHLSILISSISNSKTLISNLFLALLVSSTSLQCSYKLL